MTILKTKNLDIGYKDGKNVTSIISDINITLDEGDLVCLLGANGKGKSTLLRTLAGTQSQLSGSIEICGKDINKLSKRKLAKILGLVYTDRTLAGGLTVTELVELGRQPHTNFLGKLSQYDKLVVNNSLKDAGIYNKRDSFIADLSDGERQKSMIAKALAQETPLIFLDEPTAFLDVSSKIETLQLLHRLAHKNNKAIIFSSHDISQSLLLANKLWLIDSTSTLTAGTTEDVILSGKLSSMFTQENIDFDITDGLFKAKTNYLSKVSIHCNSDILSHWLCNALQRMELEPIVNGNDYDINITMSASDDITISKKGDKDILCKSIEELTKELTRYFNIKVK